MFSHATVLNDSIDLPDGTSMNIKYSLPANETFGLLPSLVFIHGSFHAAWCWMETFMPYFARLGYPCIALNLRGTSECPTGDGIRKVTIDQHTEDVLHVLEYINKRVRKEEKEGRDEHCDETMRLLFDYIERKGSHQYMAPIIMAHSFGGLIAMKLLEKLEKRYEPLLSSIAVLCSMPPSGITKMSLRALRRNPLKGWRIMRGLAMKRATTTPKLCRSLFFDEETQEEDIRRYMSRFQEDSQVTIDLRDLADKLPALATGADGCSTNIRRGVLKYQALVLGAEKDFIVDADAVAEAARFFDTKAVTVKGAVHDVMLAQCWNDVAEEIERWLSEIVAVAESSHLPQ